MQQPNQQDPRRRAARPAGSQPRQTRPAAPPPGGRRRPPRPRRSRTPCPQTGPHPACRWSGGSLPAGGGGLRGAVHLAGPAGGADHRRDRPCVQRRPGRRADASGVAEATPTPEPTPDPAEERIAAVTARNGANANLNPTQATDPDTWNASAVSILEGLQTQFSDLDLTVQEGLPYLIAVNREAGVVTVYASDNDPENPRYTVPYMAMVCSGGPDTPTGVFNTPVNYDWRLLSGPLLRPVRHPHLGRLPVPQRALLHPAQG